MAKLFLIIVFLSIPIALTLNMSGMEGSPVFSEQAEFIGVLTRPLRQKISGTEVQVCVYAELCIG